jgi:hypothetical protein
VSADVRYIRYHAWWCASGNTTSSDLLFAYLAENLLETWVPPDRSQDWLLRRAMTGRRHWLAGDESRVNREGWPTGEWRAPYGDFYAGDERREPSESPPGLWSRPNPDWVAELPRTPALLLEHLRIALPPARQDDAMLLHHAAQALRSGLLPADLVTALYEALAGLPSATVHESVANLDGQAGTALVVEKGIRIEELIIDLDAGEYLGERTTQTKTAYGIPADTVTSFGALSSAMVEALGDVP